jgi:crotonobetainyl-CoA:carnitine CoA-transferase CaiB-like acyl-CoA transferase
MSKGETNMMALEGISILDLTRLAPGPYCTMILADLGADVLKVEEPGPPTGRRAEQAGAAGVSLPQLLSPDSPHYSLNRNKRSIALNLKSEEGREIFYDLTKESDVLVEEMRPGVSKRLGIDYPRLKEINPRLVYCSITGYGQNGPYRDLVGHDINYISLAGALGVIGEKGRRPAIPLNILADYAGGGMHGAIGIMAALLAREKTGRGQYVDIAMTDGVVSLFSWIYSDYFGRGFVPERGSHFTSGDLPYYDCYATKDDKYITIGSMEPWFYANLCRALGREDLIPYQAGPKEKQVEIRRIFTEIFLTKTQEEWFEILGQTDVCVGKVLTFDEAERDPQLQARQMFVELDHPDEGKVKQVGISMKLSDTPGSIRDFPPRRGEHTDEVLTGLGYSQKKIAALRQKGCVH